MNKSLPTRGEWVEILIVHIHICYTFVSPHTGRVGWNLFQSIMLSPILCLSPHGESGLKYRQAAGYCWQLCLSPHGESGLKFCQQLQHPHAPRRLSPHGESGLKLSTAVSRACPTGVSPHTGRVGWNIFPEILESACTMSLPTRGEWVEIDVKLKSSGTMLCLSPHGESGLKSSDF